MTDSRKDDSVTARPDPATLDEQRAGDEIADLTAQIAQESKTNSIWLLFSFKNLDF